MNAPLLRLSALLLACAAGCGANTRNWVVVETANLRVRTDIGPEKAVDLAARYQRMHDAIAEYELPCAFDRLTAPLEVTVRDRPQEESYFRSSQSPLLGLRPQLVLSSADGRDSVRVFTHEMAHQLVAVCFPGAPAWLNEGLAAFYETARLDDGELTLGYPPYVFLQSEDWRAAPIHQRELDGERVFVLANALAPTVAELRAMRRAAFYSLDDVEKVANYAGAWALVHLLRFGEPRFYAPFVRYERALHAGEKEPTAWDTNFGGLNVASRYQRYLTEDYFARARQVQTLPEVGLQARPMSPEEVALLLAELQRWDDKRGVQRAETLIQQAEEAQSTRIDAMVLRAALHLRQGDQLRASSVLAKAHEEDPADADVLAALLAVQLGAGEPTLAAKQRLGDWLVALQARATSAQHFAIASAWEMQLNRDPYAALRSALRAIELDGTNLFGYWLAGDAYRSLGDLRAALSAYQAALALSGHLVDENRRTLESQIAAVRAMLGE